MTFLPAPAERSTSKSASTSPRELTRREASASAPRYWRPAGPRLADLVIAAAENFLKPDIEHDEEVATAHLFHLQLRLAGGAVGPGRGDDGEAVAADDGLQGQLDGQVEVLGEQRLDGFDDLALVCLEGVGGVVVAVPEEHPDELVGEPVDEELQRRIVVDVGAGHEARAEGAVPALFEQPDVANEVARVVGGVSHHDRHRVALEDVEAGPDRHPHTPLVVG